VPRAGPSRPRLTPATNRAANFNGPAAGSSTGGPTRAAGDGPGTGLTPLTASAYGTRESRYQSGASSTTRTSVKPAASIQPL
jgi:hypothetical protein